MEGQLHAPGEEPAENLREVGRYKRMAKAQDHGLVILSMGIAYWLMPLPQGGYGLYVQKEHLEAVREQLARSERENRHWPPRPDLLPDGKGSAGTIVLYALLIWGVFLVAQEDLVRAGSASEEAIRAGEWWRAITALTLHGDWAHLVANTVGGFLFFGLVFCFLGVGFGWIAILLAGFLGNLLNAWSYAGTGHNSIGASTAVFGALGIVVGFRILRQFRLTRWSWPRHLWVPLAAGVILLGFLGAGGERTDVLAHAWGFLTGLLLGAGAAGARVDEKEGAALQQRLLGWLTLLAVMGAWTLALR